jgi:hypothetical protein
VAIFGAVIRHNRSPPLRCHQLPALLNQPSPRHEAFDLLRGGFFKRLLPYLDAMYAGK